MRRRVVSYVLALVCLAIPAVPGAEEEGGLDPATLTLAPPPPPLSPFQWALRSGGGLLLVPDGDVLYPARRVGEGVIETLPLGLEVEHHRDGTVRTVALHTILSPFEIAPADWLMQIADPAEAEEAKPAWRTVDWRVFDGEFFYHRVSPGSLEAVLPEDIRFVRR